MSKNDYSINSIKNKLNSIETCLTEVHSKATDENKEKIEQAMNSVIKASEDLSNP